MTAGQPTRVWVPMDHRVLVEDAEPVQFTVLGDKYAEALRDGAGAQAIAFPLVGPQQIDALLPLVHGVLLTGSPSNVHPSHFGESVADPSLPLDPRRDALTLPLVRACLAHGVPLLGICRGFQEINVALGGSLHQRVHAVPGLADHREPADRPLDEQYALRHRVHFEPGSVFEDWAGGPQALVNSLHGQGVHRLARGLRAAGHAPDGLIEAFGIEGASAFAYAVQWHPEWRWSENRLCTALFAAFGAACRERRQRIEGERNDTGTQHEFQ
jgi:putative glutamine amidotransferase